MSDSITTKLVIRDSFRSLMTQCPFSKISIGDICQECNMNRKSFYYHFKDKYDLINWIFDYEFPFFEGSGYFIKEQDTFKSLCRYFYEHRAYYKKVFEIEGQNSFSEHLYDKLYVFIKLRFENCDDFMAHFWADALLCALKDWILDRKSLHYDDFCRRIKLCVSPAVSLA